MARQFKKMIQNNLIRCIENPEDEYQKEFERKQKLRIKARQKYNEGNNILFICSLCKLQNCY